MSLFIRTSYFLSLYFSFHHFFFIILNLVRKKVINFKAANMSVSNVMSNLSVIMYSRITKLSSYAASRECYCTYKAACITDRCPCLIAAKLR